MSNNDPTTDLPRRTFLKGAGVAAGAALLGTGATASAAAEQGFSTEFANPRVREVAKVWARGIRGHPERTLGITDTGIDGRHPDLGPWNGVTVIDGTEIDTDGDGNGITLTTPEALENRSVSVAETFTKEEGNVRFTAQVLPGAFVATGQAAETVIGEFTVGGSDADGNASPAPTPDADVLEAKLFWDGYNPADQPLTANFNDLELRIDVQTDDGNWTPVATAASADMPEVLEIDLESGATYRYVAEKYTQTVSQEVYVEETFSTKSALDDSLGADFDPFADGAKLVGWHDAGARYNTFAKPRDPNGHGSHCSSIMAGSGRASAVDHSTLTVEEPNAVLAAGDFRDYPVTVEGGTGVFISALGDGIEVTIEGPDGRTLEDGVPNVAAGEAGLPSDLSLEDSAVAEVAVPPGEGGTYTCYVHPVGESTASAGRVEKVAVGTFRDPATVEADGAVENGDLLGDVSLHSGVAPNARLFGLQGLASPLPFLASSGHELAETFGIRSVNMSWGPGDPVVGLATPPFGAAGGALSDRGQTIKQIAENGILSVAAAGNSFTPGQSAFPALADEAISVAATGPLDGLTSYSSGGAPTVDDDSQRQYIKPDVTAPGGYLTDTVKAAKAKIDTYDDDEFVQDYTGKAGTSMATPYTNGVVGLVAEAMEFDLPEFRDGEERRPAGVTLPEPSETDLADVMRLKSVICATATETAFTAAPYHRAHAPTYGFGEKDVYEGYGRVNPDAAVDAVTRELVDLSTAQPNQTYTNTVSGAVGLNVPEDSRALAGFVDAPKGSLDVSVSVSHLSGGNKGMAKGSPHVDLFVYDIANPSEGGEPTVAAKAQGLQGSASVSVSVAEPSAYVVVAKLVNVPGVVNGYDVQAHLDLETSVTVADLPTFTVVGSRQDDGDVFRGGQTDQVDITVDELDDGVDSVTVYDVIPDSWTVVGGDGTEVGQQDGDVSVPDGRTLVKLGTVNRSEVMDLGDTSRSKTFTYFVKAGDSPGQFTLGPARADMGSGAASSYSNEVATFGGTDENVVVGTSPDSGSTGSTSTDTTTGTTATDAGSTDTGLDTGTDLL
ncbi:S8 family serine peptidase [Halorarius litoreus]|uniref:S8 family serine peptidase n=1 Tax=Halorarius litoreus TaxID=2962676 RepID=UPI0020CD5C0E|nr:S8 family serine peptidase [Halorarius litoreus]